MTRRWPVGMYSGGPWGPPSGRPGSVGASVVRFAHDNEAVTLGCPAGRAGSTPEPFPGAGKGCPGRPVRCVVDAWNTLQGRAMAPSGGEVKDPPRGQSTAIEDAAADPTSRQLTLASVNRD